MSYAIKNASLIFEHINVKDLDPGDISVDGFDIHESLDPKIWDDKDVIRQEIRNRLVEIVDDFVDSLPFESEVEDIRLTGSLASFNWSKFSDIDLHIVMNFKNINEDIELVRDYFNAKQAVWNLKHEIVILGYEVEIYVENVGDPHIALGKYSLLRNEWIDFPTKDIDVEIDKSDARKKAFLIARQIDHVENISQEDPLDAEKMAERIKDKIRKMRKSGLDSKKGIYSSKNIAFKILRRNGYLQRLSDIKTQSYDRAMSLAGE
jgi:mRNA-degrading endonuclease YafQ of YafQ-DinJ toxin-antitoxin module